MRLHFVIWLAVVTATFQLSDTQSNFYERRYFPHRRPSFQSFLSSASAQSHAVARRPTDSHGSRRPAEPVHLDIYYETNCPDSMRFITRQLYPLYQDMKDVIKICLVPFGKATAKYNEVSKRYDFMCHHGPAECQGNTIQSCAISLYPKLEDHLNLVNCMEAYYRPSSNGEKCARRLSLDWKKISKCADGEEGNRLLYQNAKLTEDLNPRLDFVPWIVVNKVYTREQQSKSLRDIRRVVCDHLKGQHSKCSRYSY